MTPQEIKDKFGEDALNMLYDDMLQNPKHELVDWVFELTDEAEIAEWVADLKQDMED